MHSKCICGLHVTTAATAIRRVWYVYKWATLHLWKLRKNNQMRKAKAVYNKGETRWSLEFCRNRKAGRGVEEFSGGRNWRASGVPWLETVGLRQLQANWKQAILLVRGTYVAFSGWSWAGSRDKKLQKLSFINQVLGIWGWFFTELVFCFLDCHWTEQTGCLQKFDY